MIYNTPRLTKVKLNVCFPCWQHTLALKQSIIYKKNVCEKKVTLLSLCWFGRIKEECRSRPATTLLYSCQTHGAYRACTDEMSRRVLPIAFTVMACMIPLFIIFPEVAVCSQTRLFQAHVDPAPDPLVPYRWGKTWAVGQINIFSTPLLEQWFYSTQAGWMVLISEMMTCIEGRKWRSRA